MGLKIDTEKAYDRLEWNFLLNVLKFFRFPSMWDSMGYAVCDHSFIFHPNKW